MVFVGIVFVSVQAVVLLLAALRVAAKEPPVITRVADISALSREAAATGLAVRVGGADSRRGHLAQSERLFCG